MTTSSKSNIYRMSEPSHLGFHIPWLRSRAHRFMGPALRRVTSTSELVQSTLVVAVKKFARIAECPEPVVRGWLATTMEQIVCNLLGKAVRHPNPLGDHEPPDPTTPVPNNFDRDRLHATVRRAIDTLPPDERTVILGLYDEEASPAELARRIGRTTNAVYGLHRNALQRLAKLLGEPTP